MFNLIKLLRHLTKVHPFMRKLIEELLLYAEKVTPCRTRVHDVWHKMAEVKSAYKYGRCVRNWLRSLLRMSNVKVLAMKDQEDTVNFFFWCTSLLAGAMLISQTCSGIEITVCHG